MRTPRPASWFLQAARSSQKASIPPRPRALHATCQYQQPGDREPPRTSLHSADHNAENEVAEVAGSDSTAVSVHNGRRLKTSSWSPKDAKQTLQKRKAKAEGARELLRMGVKEIRRYTPQELKQLRTLYTPQQIEALIAAEEAINPEDVVAQGELRTDPAGLAYLDDLSSVDPVLDKLAQSPEFQYGTKLDSPGRADASVESAEKGGREKGADFSGGPLTAAQKRIKDADEDPHMLRLCQQTGFTKEQIAKFKVKTLVHRRVTNQTRMGKISSMYQLTIAGNGNGLLGVGEGKAAEGEDATRQAIMSAIRNMKPVHRYEDRTIYGEVEAKVGAVRVKLMPRAPGEYSPYVFKADCCAKRWQASDAAHSISSSKCAALRASAI